MSKPGGNGPAAHSAAPKTRKQVVAALIRKDGEFLCCRRTEYQSLPLKWEFPGGKIEVGETAQEALRRELVEELGIDAEIGEQVAEVNYSYPHGPSVALYFFLVERYERDLQNCIFREIRWVPRKDLPSLDFLEADKEIVRKLADNQLA